MMRDNQRIIKYNVEFNRLAIQTGWSNNVLRHRYYSGLADRIKDIMGHHSKPSTLDDMKKLAYSIDSHHWERQREKSHSKKSTPPKSNRTPPRSNNHSNNDNSNKKSYPSTSNSNKSSKPASANSTAKPDISDKLKDGKLTTQERQRRMDSNLCMYCGAIGHKAQDCTKSNSSAVKTKGRAAQVKEKPVTATPTSGED